MLFLYELFMPIVAILLLPVILLAFVFQPKFRAGFKEKIGFYTPLKKKNTSPRIVVFHAVSVGEVNAIENTVKKYRELNPTANIILTTTTKTGQDVANKKLKSCVDLITYFPYDFLFSVKSFFDTYNPSKVIIAETEIWPCFVDEAYKRGIKVYIANGRISPNSYKGYKKFSFFFKVIFERYAKILTQSKPDADRLIDIGADRKKVKVMGNLKYDIEPQLNNDEITELAYSIGLNGQKVIVAASTHSGEDEIVLHAYKNLQTQNPNLKLVLAPRHPQRYEHVENLLKNKDFKYGKRSENAKFDTVDVIMLDTMGELAKFFSIAHIAFIGGSFSETGGHNPLEANIYGKPVVSGPNIFNFKSVYALLTKSGAAKIVKDKLELQNELQKSLSDSEYYEKTVIAAKKIFKDNKGAIDFLINELSTNK